MLGVLSVTHAQIKSSFFDEMNKSQAIQMGVDLTNYDTEFYKYVKTKYYVDNIEIVYILDKNKSKIIDVDGYNKLHLMMGVNSNLKYIEEGDVNDDSVIYKLISIRGNKGIIIYFWNGYIVGNENNSLLYSLVDNGLYWEIIKI